MLLHRAWRGRAVVLPAPNWHALPAAVAALHAPAAVEGASTAAAAPSAAAAPVAAVAPVPVATPAPAAAEAGGGGDGKGDVKTGTGGDAKARSAAGTDDGEAKGDARTGAGGGRGRGGKKLKKTKKPKPTPKVPREPVRKPIVAQLPVSVLTRHVSAVHQPQPPVPSARALTELRNWSLLQPRAVRWAPPDPVRDSVHALRERLCKLDADTQQPPHGGLVLPLGRVPRHAADCEGQYRSALLAVELQRVIAAERDVTRLYDTHALWELHDAVALLDAAIGRANAHIQRVRAWQSLQVRWRDTVVRHCTDAKSAAVDAYAAAADTFLRVAPAAARMFRALSEFDDDDARTFHELQTRMSPEQLQAFQAVRATLGALLALLQCTYPADRDPNRSAVAKSRSGAHSRSERCALLIAVVCW